MLRSFLIGAASGARSLTPIALTAQAARAGRLPADNAAAKLLGNPIVAGAVGLLAAGELYGDKLASSPDRIIAPGIAARMLTAGAAGAALAPREKLAAGALLGAAGAVAASYVTFALRMRAMRRFGQVSTGLVEDALVGAAAAAVLRG